LVLRLRASEHCRLDVYIRAPYAYRPPSKTGLMRPTHEASVRSDDDASLILVIARLRALKNHTHIFGSTSLKGRKTTSTAQARRCRGAPIY
jgi:hypothetical protein